MRAGFARFANNPPTTLAIPTHQVVAIFQITRPKYKLSHTFNAVRFFIVELIFFSAISSGTNPINARNGVGNGGHASHKMIPLKTGRNKNSDRFDESLISTGCEDSRIYGDETCCVALLSLIYMAQILCFFTYICQNLNLTLQQIQAWLRSVFWVLATWEKYISSY
jgi:hypothetical protein